MMETCGGRNIVDINYEEESDKYVGQIIQRKRSPLITSGKPLLTKLNVEGNGIPNFGNTCFLASVVTALLRSKFIVEFIAQKARSDCASNSFITIHRILTEIQRGITLNDLSNRERLILAFHDLYELYCGELNGNHSHGEMQCAQETLALILHAVYGEDALLPQEDTTIASNTPHSFPNLTSTFECCNCNSKSNFNAVYGLVICDITLLLKEPETFVETAMITQLQGTVQKCRACTLFGAGDTVIIAVNRHASADEKICAQL